MNDANSDKILLNVSNFYNISTKKQNYVNKGVQVISILSYADISKRANFDLNTLAINEKVMAENLGDYELRNYFVNKTFYFCYEVDIDGTPDPETHIVLWNDVLDEKNITQLNITYKFNLNLSLPTNFSDNIQDMIDKIKLHLIENYGNDIGVDIITFSNDISESEMSEYELLVKRSKELDKIYDNLNRITLASDIIDKLSNSELLNKTDTALASLKEITSSISYIRSKIGVIS